MYTLPCIVFPMSNAHLASPATASAVAAKTAAVRNVLAECLLPEVAVSEEARGRDFGFVIYGASVEQVERTVRGLGVKVEDAKGFTLAWFRIG